MHYSGLENLYPEPIIIKPAYMYKSRCKNHMRNQIKEVDIQEESGLYM